MALPNVFTQSVTDELVNRINNLNTNSQPKWGKMNVAQMLAHCNVTYELVYEDKHPRPKGLKKFLLKAIVMDMVTNEVPYNPNSRTAAHFLVTDQREFEKEKQRLVDYIIKTRELGEAHFNGKDSHSFGPLSTREWNNMFYKHLDHHLRQFVV